MNKKKLLIVVATVFLLTSCDDTPNEVNNCNFDYKTTTEKFDVVINNGRVMDPECDFDGVRNVGITNGKIATITGERISGVEEINATGHVVTAGFIDTQAHSAGTLWGAKVGLRDGLTTPMDFELGAINIDKWYAERENNFPVNYGTVVSHEYHRMKILDKIKMDKPYDAQKFVMLRGESYKENDIPDWAVTPASLEQLNEILKNMDTDIRAGALGVGSTVGYMAKGVTTFELFKAHEVAANYKKTFAAHVRFLGNTKPPTEGTLGAIEIITNGIALNSPTLVSHNHSHGWWEIEERLQLLRDQGYNVWSEYYPYHCGSTSIGSEFLKPDVIDTLGAGYKDMVNPITGKNMNQKEYEKLVKKDPAFIVIMCLDAKKEWINYWLNTPHMTMASDAMPVFDKDGKELTWDSPYEAYSGHPRTAGSRARSLRLAREQGVPLMHTLKQLSYWSAKHLGDAGIEAMKIRGRMQVGMVADIVVFNPKTVTDNADYKLGKNGLPSTGIPYVLVNGTIMVKDSVVQNKKAGQPIRYPATKESKLKHLDKKSYLGDILIQVPDIDDHGAGEVKNNDTKK